MSDLHQEIQIQCKRQTDKNSGKVNRFELSIKAKQLDMHGVSAGYGTRLITLFVGPSLTGKIRLIRALGREAIDSVDFKEPQSVIFYVEDAVKPGGERDLEDGINHPSLKPVDVSILQTAYTALKEGVGKRENELRIGSLLGTVLITEGECRFTVEDANELYELIQDEENFAKGVEGFINSHDTAVLLRDAPSEGDLLTPAFLRVSLDRYTSIQAEGLTPGAVER